MNYPEKLLRKKLRKAIVDEENTMAVAEAYSVHLVTLTPFENRMLILKLMEIIKKKKACRCRNKLTNIFSDEQGDE